jgi:hypothetical protein
MCRTPLLIQIVGVGLRSRHSLIVALVGTFSKSLLAVGN